MGRMFDRKSMVNAPDLPRFVIAYQPIVNVSAQRIVAYEALTRGLSGISYPQLIAGMDLKTLHAFHRATSAQAIRRAVELGIVDLDCSLCLNLQPDLTEGALNAEFVLGVATACGLPASSILLELTEDHKLTLPHMQQLLARNQEAGFYTAVDDFGAGYSGLTMLVECRPELLKLDRGLIRSIDTSDPRQRIVAAFVDICSSMNMTLVAEGVETVEECAMLRKLGIDYMQGFLFARAGVDELPQDAVWGVRSQPRPFTRDSAIADIARWLPYPRSRDSAFVGMGVTLPA